MKRSKDCLEGLVEIPALLLFICLSIYLYIDHILDFDFSHARVGVCALYSLSMALKLVILTSCCSTVVEDEKNL